MARFISRVTSCAILGIGCGLIAVASCGFSSAAEPSRAMLGVIPKDANGQVIVKDVYVGSPAGVAGLRAGDRIIAVNDKTVNTAAELIDALAPLDVDARVELRASRDGWTKQVQVTLAKRDDVAKLPLASTVAAQQPRVRQTPSRSITIDQFRMLDDPAERRRRQRW
jgi:predicted metalloprotease with PDZ domain